METVETEEKAMYLQFKEELNLLTTMMQRIIKSSDYKGKERMVKQYSDLINDKIFQYQTKIKHQKKQQTTSEHSANIS